MLTGKQKLMQMNVTNKHLTRKKLNKYQFAHRALKSHTFVSTRQRAVLELSRRTHLKELGYCIILWILLKGKTVYWLEVFMALDYVKQGQEETYDLSLKQRERRSALQLS